MRERVNLAEAGRRLFRSASGMWRLSRRPGFPTPCLDETGKTALYWYDEIEEWVHQWDTRNHTTGVRLTESQREYCKSMGDNVSEGIRNVIDDHMNGRAQ